MIAGAFLVQLALLNGQGDINGGWTISPHQLQFGFARIMFSFFAGILLMRSGIRIRVKGAFWICNLLLLLSFLVPRLGGLHHMWLNGLYEAVCAIFLYPIIVAMGAGESVTEGITLRLSRFLGDLSYPLYVTHSALINIYDAWVADNKVPADRGTVVAILALIASAALAWLSRTRA